MKKVLSLVLALVLLLSVSATAFADEKPAPQTVTSVDIYKHYRKTVPAPAETFTFTVAAESVTGNDLTKNDMLSLANTASGSNGNYTIAFDADTATSITTDGHFTINFENKFNRVGTYTYKITETASNTAGVTYDNTPVYLVITVLADTNGTPNQYYVALHKGTADGSKASGTPGSTGYVPAFTNTFTATTPTPPSGGEPGGEQPGGDDNNVTALSLKKTVSGTYGDTKQYFDFSVEFTVPTGKTFDGTISVNGTTSYTGANGEKNPTAITKDTTTGKYTATFKLKADETLTFGSVPVGMGYKFDETNAYGHTATKTACEGTVTANQNIQAVIDNHRDTEIPTGISLDSLPYVIILATVAAAALLIVLKKKAKRA